MQLGPIYYDGGRYKEASETFENIRNFEAIWTVLCVAASHAQLGHLIEAQQTLQRALKFNA
jgi:hypothetical protein